MWGEKGFLLAAGAFGQLLLRVPLQSFMSSGQFLEREGKSLFPAPLWFLTQSTDVSGPMKEILQLLGVAVPWKGKCPASFPSSLARAFQLGNNKHFSAVTLLGICLRKGS